jgi:hypothetical protein
MNPMPDSVSEFVCNAAPPFSVERYRADRKCKWDTFVEGAKNATFLFLPDYTG